jgi:hypothetical protein
MSGTPHFDEQVDHVLSLITLVIGNQHIRGAGESERLKFTPDEAERWRTKLNALGDKTRAYIEAPGGVFELRVMSTNRAMLKFFLEWERAIIGEDKRSLEFYDPMSGLRITAEQCWLKNRPERTWGKEVGEVVFQVETKRVQVEYT